VVVDSWFLQEDCLLGIGTTNKFLIGLVVENE
jgi:hypothetical protein